MFLHPVYPMPIPRTHEAPCFNGHNLSEFMNILESHLSRAQIVDEDIRVKYLMRYSTDTIRQAVGRLPELDRSRTGKSWEEAKIVLHDFYGYLDEHSPRAKFLRWVQSAADHPMFVSKAQVNTYYLDFMSRGQSLLDNAQISKNDLSFAFIQGAPSSMKATLRELIPDERRNRSTPYTIKNTLALLHSLAIQDSPMHPDPPLSLAPRPPSSDPMSHAAPYAMHTSTTHLLLLSPSSPASPAASLVSRSTHVAKQQSRLEHCLPESCSDVPRSCEPQQDWNTRDEMSRLEAKYTHASSDGDHAAKLDVQTSRTASPRSSRLNPTNRGDLYTAAHAAQTHVSTIRLPTPSPHGVRTCGLLYSLYPYALDLHHPSPAHIRDKQPFLDRLDRPGRARVGVGGDHSALHTRSRALSSSVTPIDDMQTSYIAAYRAYMADSIDVHDFWRRAASSAIRL
ncbi:hypothetical protein OH76DRAFT_1423641 [Lentinus brumalis]|uniref:Uncharacterized protein n=1 Tax=Lentinus brumalis TaxID=2498619 RepID=A0A371CJU2_9APHY|nr:hypothetical protein OH76DRAFT_1423641 [Polyporus brumalis]